MLSLTTARELLRLEEAVEAESDEYRSELTANQYQLAAIRRQALIELLHNQALVAIDGNKTGGVR